MNATAEKTKALGPYSRPAALAKLDQRTKEARLIRETRDELVRHVGGRPSATQAVLIETLCQMKLRLALMDRALSERGTSTAHDHREYLALANGFARGLSRLGMKGAVERGPDLAAYLAQRGATGQASPRPIETVDVAA